MKRKNNALNTAQAYLFLLPAIVFMGVFLYRPMIESIRYSFMNFKNFLPNGYVGFSNYIYLFHDPQFRNGIILTFQWALLNALLPTVVGLVLALMLEFFTRSRRLAGISRTILFMPQMMSLVAVGLLWSLLYDTNIGVITGFMKVLGIPGKFFPYANTDIALYVAFIPVIWYGAGFSMVVFSAALQGISRDVIESSMVEGAKKLQQILYIFLPGIVKTITMLVTINLISGFKAFDLIYVLTGGGPGTVTEVASVYAYKKAFVSYRFDFSSATMTCLLLCVIVFILILNAISRRAEERFGA
jgi:raffinose/stachyose/melibiose transport system permease protein